MTSDFRSLQRQLKTIHEELCDARHNVCVRAKRLFLLRFSNSMEIVSKPIHKTEHG